VHTQVITVQDTTDPTWDQAMPADIVVECDAVPAAFAPVTASDNCDDVVEVEYNEARTDGNCPDNYTLTRTWTATDNCGNETVHTQVITVQDTTDPVWDQSMPGDLTVECDDVPVAFAPVTASDNCDASVQVTLAETDTQDPNINNCGHYNYQITRVWTATDNCGNAITHTQVITVEDIVAPTFTKPADVTIYTSQGATCPTTADISLVINQNNPIAVGGAPFTYTVHGINFNGPDQYGDNCADTAALEIRVHNVQPNFDGNATNCYRQIRVVWRVYDPCGNYTARQQFFTIIDDTPPTFTVPADVTVFADAQCGYDISTSITGMAENVMDNCTAQPGINFSDSAPVDGQCEGERIITRTWVVMDDCGNATTQTQIITVTDTISPTFTVPADITIYKDAMCIHNADIGITGDVTDEADNCTSVLDATFSDAAAPGSCDGELIILRTWSLVDDCGNETLQTQAITVLDTILPIFPKPADITLSTENGAECPGIPVVDILADQMMPKSSGNQPFDFKIHGITIQGPTVYSDNCSAPANQDIYLWQVNENWDGAADECYRLIRLLWRVYDDCGNYQPRQQFFTIIDNTAPSFTAPDDMTIFTDEYCQYDASIGITGDVTDEEDNCEIGLQATWSDEVVPGNCEGEVIITRTWMLEDQCGNAAAPQVQIITVRDDIPPTFTVPADITILKDAQCNHNSDISITGDVSDEADNCTSVLDATWSDVVDNGSCEGEVIITRLWRLEDDCGNITTQEQIITVKDSINPIFPKPADITLSTLDGATCPAEAQISLVIDQSSPVATGNEPFTFMVHGIEINGPTVYTDNCSSPENLGLYVWNIQENFDGMAGNCYRQIRVIWRVYDDCGNFQQRQQLFTILEETPPVALCKDVTIYLDINGEVVLEPSDVDDGSSDNCDPDPLKTVDKSFFTCADVGNNPVTFTIEDFCGLSDQCLAKVQVLDTIPPTMLCKNATINLNQNGLAFLTIADIDNGSNDACGIASLVLSRTEFYCSDLGSQSVTLTGTDVNGNVASCQGIVTVQDLIAPVAFCKDITVPLNPQGVFNLMGFMVDNGSFDNCGITTYNVTPSQFTCANVGQNAVVLVVSDLAGNTASCTALVNVVDDASPTMACKNITLYINANGDPITIQPADIDNGSQDNCGVTLSLSRDVFGCNDIGNNNVKLFGVDPSGNTGECSAIVQVRDTIFPVWTFLPGDVTVYCVENGASEVPLAEDNCSVVQVTLKSADQELWPQGPMNSYQVRRIWQAIDAAGNTIFYEQIVYVLPGGELFVNCTPDIVTPETNIPIQVTWPIPFVDDICAGKEDMYQIGGPLPGSYFNPGSETVITYEYIDFFGTRWQCSFWVTVPTDSSDYVLILNEQDCKNLLLEACQVTDPAGSSRPSFSYRVIGQPAVEYNLVAIGSFEAFADGSARLVGRWENASGLCGWDMDIWFHRRRTHAGWIAAGGGVFPGFQVPQPNPANWEFYEVDGSRSTMSGLGCHAGQEWKVTSAPNFPKSGLQTGPGANRENNNNGGFAPVGIRNPVTESAFAEGIFAFDLNCTTLGNTLKDAASVISLDGFNYPVVWSNGTSGPELGDVPPGNYSVTITDQFGKDSVATFVLNLPTDCERYFENQCRPGNMTQGGVAKQISTLMSAAAGRAIDDNTDGDFANGSVSSTLDGFQNWWSLDLIIPVNAHKIRIWNRSDCCGEWLDPLWIFVSDSHIPDFGIPEEIAQLPWVTAFYHDGPVDEVLDIDFQGMARFVKVQLGQFGRLQLAEVQVLVCQPDEIGLKTDGLVQEEEEEASRATETEQIPEVLTWPNPASQFLELEVRQEQAQPVTLSIVNLQGKEMYRIQLPAEALHRLRVDVGGWAPGQYFLTTTSPLGARSQPITIQR
jgi:hypothetical protein